MPPETISAHTLALNCGNVVNRAAAAADTTLPPRRAWLSGAGRASTAGRTRFYNNSGNWCHCPQHGAELHHARLSPAACGAAHHAARFGAKCRNSQNTWAIRSPTAGSHTRLQLGWRILTAPVITSFRSSYKHKRAVSHLGLSRQLPATQKRASCPRTPDVPRSAGRVLDPLSQA